MKFNNKMAFIDTLIELEAIPIFGVIFSVCKIGVSIWAFFIGIGTTIFCIDDEDYCCDGSCCSTLPKAAFSAALTFFVEALANIITIGFYQFFKQIDFSQYCNCQCVNGQCEKIDLCCLHIDNRSETNV